MAKLMFGKLSEAWKGEATWQMLSVDLPAWNESLQILFGSAAASIEEESA